MKENGLEVLWVRGSRDVWISTFHSMCVRILRRDIDRIGFNRKLYDSGFNGPSNRLLKEFLKDKNIDPKKFGSRNHSRIH